MPFRGKHPPVTWWQTKSEVSLHIDLLLDDLVSVVFRKLWMFL